MGVELEKWNTMCLVISVHCLVPTSGVPGEMPTLRGSRTQLSGTLMIEISELFKYRLCTAKLI